MARISWTGTATDKSELNGGYEFNTDDQLTIESLNQIVNNGLHLNEVAEATTGLATNQPDNTNADVVGTPTVEIIGTGSEKKFKFSNLKGATGATGATGEQGPQGVGAEYLWAEKTWTGLTSFRGNYIWNDGTNIYYSDGSIQYVFNRETNTWAEKTWTGLTFFYGTEIWTDGTNIYRSYATSQKILNKETNTWTDKTWAGLSSFNGAHIWTDNINYYYSNGSTQYVLDIETSTWTDKTWIGLTDFAGGNIWTDNINYYYSDGSTQYVLDKATSTWSIKAWAGFTNIGGSYIWTDGINVYYSYSTNQYILDKATSTWSIKAWAGLSSFNGEYIWTDGVNYFYSGLSIQYALILPFATYNGVETLKNKTLTDPIIERIKNGTNYLSVPTLTSDETIATTSDLLSQYAYNSILPYTSWTGASAPYTKAIIISGILSTDKLDVDLDLSSSSYGDVATIQDDWANIYRAVASTDTITFYASAVPTIDIPLQIKGVR